jgi:hypothetical protein
MVVEPGVHRGAFLQDGAQLVAAHPLGDGSTAMADKAGDVLDAYRPPVAEPRVERRRR